MKTSRNRIISLVLAVIMVTVLTACSGNKTPESSTPDPSSSTSAPASSTPAESDLQTSESFIPTFATVAGKYWHPIDSDILNEEAAPCLVLNEDGTCQFVVNLLSTMALTAGIYTIDGETINVTLESAWLHPGTDSETAADELLGEQYSEVSGFGLVQDHIAYHHVFTVIDENTIYISDNVCFTQPGDIFVRGEHPIDAMTTFDYPETTLQDIGNMFALFYNSYVDAVNNQDITRIEYCSPDLLSSSYFQENFAANENYTITVNSIQIDRGLLAYKEGMTFFTPRVSFNMQVNNTLHHRTTGIEENNVANWNCQAEYDRGNNTWSITSGGSLPGSRGYPNPDWVTIF